MIFGLIVVKGESSVESTSPSYKGHRYPVEVISHCVWLYFLAAKLGFTEVQRFEEWGAEQWFGVWSSVTPSG
jgi:hypothetical protein